MTEARAADGDRQAAPGKAAPAAGTPAAGGPRSGAEGVVVRDKRKIDVSASKPSAAGSEPEPAAARESEPAAAREPTDAAVSEPTDAAVSEPTDAAVSEPAAGAAAAADAAPDESSGEPVSAPSTAGESAAEEPVAAATPVAEPAAATPVEAPVSGDQEITADAEDPTDVAPTSLAEIEALRAEVEERTNDLKRVTAEYANYRKRVERDRALVSEQAIASVLTALLPILDDLDRAREHGDLTGPFGSVAEQLTSTLSKFGLTAFGEKGDPFDPTRHEAVAHQTSPDVDVPTCVEVMRRGYLMGDRLLRAAMVGVASPE